MVRIPAALAQKWEADASNEAQAAEWADRLPLNKIGALVKSNPFFDPSKVRLTRISKGLGGPQRWCKMLKELNR